MIEQTIKSLLELPIAEFDKEEPVIVNGNPIPDIMVEYIKGSNVGLQLSKEGRYCKVIFRVDNKRYTGKEYPYKQRNEARHFATIFTTLNGNNLEALKAIKVHTVTLLLIEGSERNFWEQKYIEEIVSEYIDRKGN